MQRVLFEETAPTQPAHRRTSSIAPARTGKRELVSLKVLNSQIEPYPRPKDRLQCAPQPMACPWCGTDVVMHLTTADSLPRPYEAETDRISEVGLRAHRVPSESLDLERRVCVVCPDCSGFVRRKEGGAWERATAESAGVSEQDAAVVFRCRPCLFVACRHHLYTDVNQRTGSIKLNFPDREPAELEFSCAIDVADAGPSTVAKAARILNLSRDRTRQLEAKAVGKLKGLAQAHSRVLDDLLEFVAK